MKKRIIKNLGLIVLFVAMAGCSRQVDIPSRLPPVESLPRIAHAGGAVNGDVYTNSVEAVHENYKNGFILFELDFCWTRDGHLVSIHDWEHSAKKTFGFVPKPIPTLAEFEALVEQHSQYRNITLPVLVQLLKQYPDIKIVTDIKERNLEALSLLVTMIPDYRQRIIPQIYNPDEYQPVRDMGYEDIIWTLYRYFILSDATFQQFRSMNLYAVTMPPSRILSGQAIEVRQHGIPVYAHTVNKAEDVGRYKKYGVSEIYTDFLHVDNNRAIVEEE